MQNGCGNCKLDFKASNLTLNMQIDPASIFERRDLLQKCKYLKENMNIFG